MSNRKQNPRKNEMSVSLHVECPTIKNYDHARNIFGDEEVLRVLENHLRKRIQQDIRQKLQEIVWEISKEVCGQYV